MNRFFVSHPIFSISLAVMVVLLGVISLFNLAIEQYPDITPPVVEVSATYTGADAETVNNAVTTPIAQSIMGVSDMLYMQATSANDGSMNMQITFDIDSDPDIDAILTQNNIASASSSLPSSVTQQGITTRKTQTGFLVVYALHSDGRYDGEFLSNYAYINIQNRLLKINGVGKVSIMGAGEYAMRIWLRPDVLNYYNISVDDIASAISSQAGVHHAGQFGAEPSSEELQFTYTVTLSPQISSIEEFADIVVKTLPSGEQIRLGNIATVNLGSKSYGSASLFDNRPTTVIVVYQEPGSNAVEVGKSVNAEMEHLAQRFPDGVGYATIVDSTDSIMAGIEDILLTLVIALVLVIFIIFVFIQDWRAVLIPLVAIPVSLIGTFIVFPLLGFTINVISLLGLVLAIGLVVDDAIVVVEAVQTNIEHGMSAKDATVNALGKVTSPIIATTVVLLAVFVPVSFSGGITGRLFQQFAITISVSVVFSTICALTLSPALCAMLLKSGKKRSKGLFGRFNRWFDRRISGYTSITSSMVSRTKLTATLVAVMLAVIAVIWMHLPSGFLPEEDQGYLMVFVQTPEATALPKTMQAMTEADKIIKHFPEVESTATVAGFNMIAGIAATNCGVIFVKLVPYSERKLSAQELTGLITDELYIGTPSAMCYAFIPPSIPGLGVTSGVTLEVQDLNGKGLGYLSHYTEALLDTLRTDKSIASATTQFNDGIPQRRLVVDKEQALIKGVSMDELYSQISTMLGSRYINSFNKFGRLYQTYIQADSEFRRDKYSLDTYSVVADGETVPLSSFVSVRDTIGVEFVSQFNLLNSIGVTVTPAKKASSAQVMATIEKVADKIFPDDVGFSWSGVSYQESGESSKGMFVYLIALVFVFLTLSALYESWGLPVSILLSVPLAVMGALLFVGAAHLFDSVFINDIYMQISIVMLIGLAAKNSILVVEYADKLFFDEGKSLIEATVGAAVLRVRPIIMTAFAFILGVTPLIFAKGVYATARNIMGISLVGGMLIATLAGIFLYPALYYLIARIAGFEKRRQSNIPL